MINTSVPGNLSNETNYLVNADMMFISAFRYNNVVNRNSLGPLIEEAYNSVFDNVNKFKFKLVKNDKDKSTYDWDSAKPSKFCEKTEEENDYKALNEVSNKYLEKKKSGHLIPFGLCYTFDKYNDSQLTLITINDHTYLDVKSSNLLFDQIIKYVNALLLGNKEQQLSIKTALNDMTTPTLEEFCHLIEANASVDHNSNFLKLKNLEDNMAPSEPNPITEKDFIDFSNRFEQRKLVDVDIFKVVSEISKKAVVTKNSILCALLVRAYCEIRPRNKDNPILTFGMVVAVGDGETRRKVCGNYVTIVPINVDTTMETYLTAESIQKQISDFKKDNKPLSKFYNDLQMFDLEIPRVDNVPFEFCTTNWSNTNFSKKTSLTNAIAELHFGTLYEEPKNVNIASLLSKQNVIISNGPDNKCCLSISKPIKTTTSISAILDKLKEIIEQY